MLPAKAATDCTAHCRLHFSLEISRGHRPFQAVTIVCSSRCQSSAAGILPHRLRAARRAAMYHLGESIGHTSNPSKKKKLNQSKERSNSRGKMQEEGEDGVLQSCHCCHSHLPRWPSSPSVLDPGHTPNL
jgi:hypothetical protein